MAKHTQKIRRQFANECLSVFGHFMGLALKELIYEPDLYCLPTCFCFGVICRETVQKTFYVLCLKSVNF